MNIAKTLIFIILIHTQLADVLATTLHDLINSYNYNFYNGTINVTNQADYMIDKNNNEKNDTLIINITTDAKSGNYKFIVEIIDKNGILINITEKTITNADASASVNFPSELLTDQKFNYSVRINDNNNMVFRKYNVESQTYKNYETGINITTITDENVDNNFVRINLTIYNAKAKTENITVNLAYNSSTISKREEKILSDSLQTISINFDNESIKNTHYNDNFTIDTILIGSKIFDFNQNTSIYNYEDFAKTSYIKSINDGIIDLNNNNLSEFLEINFTLEIKNNGTYTISYDLYDKFDNFVTNKSKMENLSIGQHITQTLINGSEIYKIKINGPYILSFAKLSIGNDTKDIVLNAHTTNQSFYTDYEKPNLPDLKVAMNNIFNKTNDITNISVNLSNIGNAPAFNIFLDIFNNETYKNNSSLGFLDKNTFIIYNFVVTNTSNATLFTVVADFDNLVDESDESNNIVNSLTTAITNDFDNDGINDELDTLIGDVNLINTTITNLTIKIGNSTDLAQKFNGTWKISFVEKGTMLMEFDFNLSKILNLTRIMMEKQDSGLFGYTLVSGLELEGTKTIYVDRIDVTVNGVCIKNAEITSISQISGECDNASEIKIECDGTLQSSYVCSYNSTTKKYKITGLNNSGVKQINYAKPQASALTTSTTTGGNGDASGEGSGSCLEKWECTEWLRCIDNLQARACHDVNECRTMFNKPKETKLCIIKEKTTKLIKKSIEQNNEENNEKSKNNAKYSLPKITGFLLAPVDANPNIGALIVFVIIFAGLVGYFYFFYKVD